MEWIFYQKYKCLVLFYAVITEYPRPIYIEQEDLFLQILNLKVKVEGSLLSSIYMSQLEGGKTTQRESRWANHLLEESVLVRMKMPVIVLLITTVIVTNSSTDHPLPVLMP